LGYQLKLLKIIINAPIKDDMLYRDLKISGSQPSKKSPRNSVKDIMTEEHPNNLTANENKRNSEKTQEKETYRSTKLVFYN